MKYENSYNTGEYLNLEKSQNTSTVFKPRGCEKTLIFASMYAMFTDCCLAIIRTVLFSSENPVQITRRWINLEAKDIVLIHHCGMCFHQR